MSPNGTVSDACWCATPTWSTYMRSPVKIGSIFSGGRRCRSRLGENDFILDGEIVVPLKGNYRSTISCSVFIPPRAA